MAARIDALQKTQEVCVSNIDKALSEVYALRV
jgi:hypothetical protein